MRGLVALVPLLFLSAACGSASPTPSSSSAPATATPATSPSSTASSGASTGCSQPATQSGPSFSGDPASLVLTTAELPSSSGETWTQVADGELNGQASTHQRGWQNADNSQRIEIDVDVLPDVSSAASAWPSWCQTIQSKITITRSPQCPSNMSTACITNTGTTSDNKSESVFTWQDGSVLAALLLIKANGPVDESFSGDIAAVQDKKIAGS